MKVIVFAFLMFSMLTSFSQEDKFAKQSVAFANVLINDEPLDQIGELFNDSLNNDSLILKLTKLRAFLRPNRDRIKFFTVRLDNVLPYYNINLHDPLTLEMFGDVRILFNNEDDVLIDKWMFFEEVEEVEHEIELEENLSTIAEMRPPPIIGNSPKPLSKEEYFLSLSEDKRKSQWVKWTKSQIKKEEEKCANGIKEMIADYKKVCKCGIKELSKNMNYASFIKQTEYMQGRSISVFYQKNCK